MNILAIIAVTWIGKEYRFLGLDWSYLVVLGFIGNAIFSMRFLVQWVASERQGESVIPVSFWYWSIGGSVIMFLLYFQTGSGWDPGLSPKFADLHPQFDAYPETQVCSYRSCALAKTARSRLTRTRPATRLRQARASVNYDGHVFIK